MCRLELVVGILTVTPCCSLQKSTGLLTYRSRPSGEGLAIASLKYFLAELFADQRAKIEKD